MTKEDMILAAVEGLQVDMRGLRDEVQRMYREGCAQAPGHNALDPRVRALESRMDTAAGRVWGVSSSMSVVVAAIAWLLDYVLRNR